MIHTADRVGIFGRTGSGKTTFVRHKLKEVANFSVIDPKHEFHFPGAKVASKYDDRERRIIYRSPTFGAGEQGWYDGLLQKIFDSRQPQVVVIDELYFITKINPTSIGLAKLMRMGRTRGIGVWGLTQSPIRVPHEMLSQVDHYFVFHLQDIRDQRRMQEQIGPQMRTAFRRFEEPGRKHDFIYHGVQDHRTVYYHQPYREKRTA